MLGNTNSCVVENYNIPKTLTMLRPRIITDSRDIAVPRSRLVTDSRGIAVSISKMVTDSRGIAVSISRISYWSLFNKCIYKDKIKL